MNEQPDNGSAQQPGPALAAEVERMRQLGESSGVISEVLASMVAMHRQVVADRDAAFGLLRWLSQRDPQLLSLLVEISESVENIWLDDVLSPTDERH